MQVIIISIIIIITRSGLSGSDGRAWVGDGSEDSSGDFDDDDDSAVQDCFGSLGDDAGLDIPGCIVRTSPKQESL